VSDFGNTLPTGFDVLEPFVSAWSVAGAANRAQRRNASTAAERATFFEVAKDQLAAALAYLDRKPLIQFDPSEQRLMNMMLSLCHVALAIEMQRDAEALHAQQRVHMKITRASADSQTA
jgi:hypothetical protein